MDRRRPAVVITALCVSVAVLGGPAPAVSAAQPVVGNPPIEVTDLPVLSELPPLPAQGEPEESAEEGESSSGEITAVQVLALVLAASVLVAGGLGLALVTRRDRSADLDEQLDRPSPTGPTRSG